MSDFGDRLSAALGQMGLSLDKEQQLDILNYLELIQKWNKTYNITAIKDPQQILIQHIFDSMSVVLPLQQRINPNQEAVVLDVGSGGKKNNNTTSQQYGNRNNNTEVNKQLTLKTFKKKS